MTIFQISPYAAKAIVQHVWNGAAIIIYLTFRFPMDQSNTPDRTLFEVKVDDVIKGVFTVIWLDGFTLRLGFGGIFTLPGEVTVKYEGPDPDLATTWNKQWEPWGPITSINIPIDDNNFGMITIEGGFAIKLTNKTGSNSVAGDIVIASTVTGDAVALAAQSEIQPIGAFWKSGIADGSLAWIVVSGIGDVHMDIGGCALGDRLITSVTPGRGHVNNLPSIAVHFQEIGHTIEAAAGNANARCVLHFN